MAPTIPKTLRDFDWSRYDDWSSSRQIQEVFEQMENAKRMAAEQGAPTMKDWIGIRVEAIENGFIIKYSGPGAPERVRYAQNLTDVGTQITVAAVEMKLRGAQQA